MGRHLHLDPIGGASGDMFLGLLVHLGLEPARLEELPARLGLADVTVRCGTARRGALEARRVEVTIDAAAATAHAARTLAETLAVVERGGLPDRAAEVARDAFRRLYEAESEVHGAPVETVHLHEAAADDALIDVVGTALGLEALGIETASCSVPIPLGGGQITSAHGTLPVPAPAVALLLRGVEVRGGPVARELVTPTGATLLRAIVDEFAPMPGMELDGAGFGAGTADPPGHSNVLRGVLGRRQVASGERTVSVLECAIDDMLPQDMPPLIERLLDAGARDAFMVDALMKKGRPGFRLTVVCDPGLELTLSRLLLEESTTLGVRRRRETRAEWGRDTISADTPWGPVRVKRALDPKGRVVRGMPEFEDCREAARRAGRTVDDVRRAARRAAEKDDGGDPSGCCPG